MTILRQGIGDVNTSLGLPAFTYFIADQKFFVYDIITQGEMIMHVKSNVFDVARYILEITGEISTVRLQKLIYFCQAHALVWDEEPMFTEEIEAWANGPVVRKLFDYHRGMYSVSWKDFRYKGVPDNLLEEHKETVRIILDFYKNVSTQSLVDETHNDDVFIKARHGLAPLERGDRIMHLEDIALYYSALLANEQEKESE